MVKITNQHGIDLPLAVWLLQDGYNSGKDVAPEGELISVTSLMKPTRQQILQRKVDYAAESSDVADRIASRMGHALHDSIEKAWTQGNYQRAMTQLNYHPSVINQIKINPDPLSLKKDDIPIYLEQRGFKKFMGIVLTGQLDFSINHAYRDIKTTSTFSYTSGSKDNDYILQGSLYRWIMPNLIKQDIMRIEFIFTDWVKYRAKADPKYPQTKATHKEYTLLTSEETEKWVTDKINEIKTNARLPQSQMIRCSDKELWRSADTYKYYTKTETAKANGRCTKRFDSMADAQIHLKEKGKGVVVTDPGVVKACPYCPAFTLCEQRKEYFDNEGRNL